MEPKLFSFNANSKAEEIKKFFPVSIQLDFKTISPYIALCEDKYIKPLFGKDLFDKLVLFYLDENKDRNSLYFSLMEQTQFALIRLAFWHGYDIVSVSINDSGASSKVDEGKRLFRYQEENVKASLKNEGFDKLDSVLLFLEENIEIFYEFETSKYYTELKNSLIPNTGVFNNIFNINNSRLVFLKMKYFIRDVENINLRHFLGDKFVTELLTCDQEADKYKKILPFIRIFIVYESVCEGISELQKMPTEKGLVFESLEANGSSNVSISQVSSNELERTRQYYHSKADSYLSSVIETLKNNEEDYPDFISFAGTDPQSDSVIRRDNTGKKTFFA